MNIITEYSDWSRRWTAYDGNTFDAEYDDDGKLFTRSLRGDGGTKEDAIADLMLQMEDEA